MHEEALEVLPELLAASRPHRPGARRPQRRRLDRADLRRPAPGRRAVVAIAPHVFVEDMCLVEIRKARDAYESGGPARPDGPPPPRSGRRLLRLERRVARSRSSRPGNITDELERITCPLLLIQGERDQYGTMAQLDAIERACPRSGRAACTSTASTRRRPSCPRRRSRRSPQFVRGSGSAIAGGAVTTRPSRLSSSPTTSPRSGHVPGVDTGRSAAPHTEDVEPPDGSLARRLPRTGTPWAAPRSSASTSGPPRSSASMSRPRRAAPASPARCSPGSRRSPVKSATERSAWTPAPGNPPRWRCSARRLRPDRRLQRQSSRVALVREADHLTHRRVSD